MSKLPLHNVLKSSQAPVKQVKFVLQNGSEYKSLFMFKASKDGSLIFNTGGYFLEGNWRWGYFDIPPGRTGQTNVKMLEESTMTRLQGDGPKITYHRSGWMTTKLQGHITDEGVPRIQATPLGEIDGHFFTMMVKGFQAFKTADVSSKKYRHIVVSPGQELTTLKVVGYIGNLEDLVANPEMNEEDVPGLRMIVERLGTFTTQSEFFKVVIEGKERWIKIQFWPNFPYNEGKEQPSFSMLTGWKEELASNPNETVRCLGLLAGK